MKVNGKMIKPMGMVYIYISMGLVMKEIGLKIYRMDLAKKIG